MSPRVARLTAALRAGARDVHEAAAVDMLLGLPGHLYDRPDLRARYIDETSSGVGVRWAWLLDDLRTVPVPVSDTERRMLMLACSLAIPANPVSLNEVLAGLGSPNALLILAAVERIVRGHR